ncbi:LOW QUALITY PROTEIN: oxysterol-binding protein 1-like [Drosophila sulfurigaster albostrigata]|uniref:LOW QUALITY PROTEIN: oxysterol-binding protein 1-like n=1 Tax=Drosophila sulfurigaster albostrigata TaxID=89887 RepID=UPI002D21AEEB|nr:LOW QUALITY PROTEIN: oxysterol-binding protein 1-like [Drosophila sulfurigaster albostrigata]
MSSSEAATQQRGHSSTSQTEVNVDGNKSKSLAQKVRKREKSQPNLQGYLQKWTNLVKGFQRRWFVLDQGVLSYYLDQSEAHQQSRGSIRLKGALIEHVDACTFSVTNSSGDLNFRIKAASEAERQTWIVALELAKAGTVEVASPAKSSEGGRCRRTRVPDKPNYPLSLWSIVKNCIGKDLTKIPMPVNFNEPLSMLQRLTEDYEYSDILDVASNCEDECEQLAYMAAFTASSYATSSNRINKPFNPLLGETFECDRMDDLGWRCIAEQVSHHPPIAALHCESKNWQCWQEFTMTSKFRGKYMQVIPLGTASVSFPKTGTRYSWRKVTTTINNIIVGKLWVDQEGEMEIVDANSPQGSKCILTYVPYSYFGREQQRSVKGVVLNRHKQAKWLIRGTWDEQIEIAPVLRTQGTPDNPSYSTGAYKVAWRRRPAPVESEKYYNLTTLACQLNEPEDGVAPTDSRHRPDQRLMEQGLWDESNQEKLRLEEKQRAVRRVREEKAKQGFKVPDYQPLWFKRENASENAMHVYNHKYWEAKTTQSWSDCPDIY